MLIIKVSNGNIERALKEYKSKVIKTHQMRILNSEREYEKPSVKNRRLKNKGIYVNKKKGE